MWTVGSCISVVGGGWWCSGLGVSRTGGSGWLLWKSLSRNLDLKDPEITRLRDEVICFKWGRWKRV